MNETATHTDAAAARQPIYLVVVDKTPELRVALRFACRQAARNGGRVALLTVIEPAEFKHWAVVRPRPSRP